MARDPIIADSARITPRKVFGEEITILADHTQTGSYEIYVHDAPEGVGPPLTLTHGRKPSTSSKARWILFAAMWQRLFNRAGLCMFRPERFIRSDTPAPRAYWASLRATEQLRCSLLLTESAGRCPTWSRRSRWPSVTMLQYRIGRPELHQFHTTPPNTGR
jgi:hypothetical protein